MNLVIDIGNTLSKVAVVNDGKIIEIFRYDRVESSDIEVILEKFPALSCSIMASVRNNDELLEVYLKNRMAYFFKLTHDTPIPIKNCYSTPHTLGMDRIIGAIGAVEQFPKRDILLFDLGSAITIDFISALGEYLGGNISPGMAMRFKALNQFTHKLPLCSANEEISLIGNSTHEAIVNGVVNGIIHEIDGYINEFKVKNEKIVIIFTGGDAKYFVYKVKNAIFADCDLLLKGLNKVLEYNYDKNEEI